jgi:hypothetical protein
MMRPEDFGQRRGQPANDFPDGYGRPSVKTCKARAARGVIAL